MKDEIEHQVKLLKNNKASNDIAPDLFKIWGISIVSTVCKIIINIILERLRPFIRKPIIWRTEWIQTEPRYHWRYLYIEKSATNNS